jgi:hypothetical protein
MIYGNSVGGVGIERTYILVDENGNEYPATFVDKETKFDATANDIRIGKVAATEIGMVTGEKDIPAYHTTEGTAKIDAGRSLKISMYSEDCQFTKLQAIVCAFNTNLDDSVSAEKVSIGNKVYSVNSTVVLSEVTVNSNEQTIEFNLTNEGETPVVIRYMTYREEY